MGVEGRVGADARGGGLDRREEPALLRPDPDERLLPDERLELADGLEERLGALVEGREGAEPLSWVGA